MASGEGTGVTGAGPAAVDVVLPLPLQGALTYSVPAELRDRVRRGIRVRVPLGRRLLTGFVVGEGAAPGGAPVALKPIREVVERDSGVGEELLELTRWTAEYYFASWGEVLACAVPAGRPPEVRRGLRVAAGVPPEALEAAAGRSRRRRELLARLRRRPLPAGALPPGAARLAAPLLDAGLVEWFQPDPDEEGPPAERLVLNGAQGEALDAVRERLREGGYAPFLLHGVTGSGKTEVYLRAAEEALASGRTVLYLVPEIGLTPLLARRLLSRFGGRMALLHSGLGAGERARAWRRARDGRARVVLGARSAVFAPLDDLGLIIVDEEQDDSFKQQERPRYQARDLALLRARRAGAAVVLGSATPSLESFEHARRGKYRLLRLAGRVAGRPLPRIEVVDMRSDPEAGAGVSARLQQLLRERVSRGEQSVLLLNRRGYATFVLCRECGRLVQCPDCSVSMVHHRAENRLRCHYCGHHTSYPRCCPSCDGPRLQAGGEGTERLEERLGALLPGARLRRLDRDTARRRGAAEKILGAFAAGEADVLLGTQMVAKGHDFPGVTLVGVLGAEATLGLPDFRAAERTFQLLTQVAGRSGRGSRPGRVVIQTFQPDHYAVRHAARQSYEAFFEDEMRFRRRLQYPPFTVLANVIVFHGDEGRARAQADRLAEALRRAGEGHARVLGPAPAPLVRLRGQFRVQILVKARTRGRLTATLRRALEREGGRNVTVDRDPASLL